MADIKPEAFLEAIAESRGLLARCKNEDPDPLAAAICGAAMIVGYCTSHDVALDVFFDFMRTRDPEAFRVALGVKEESN
jgi:hypothetical protein